MSRKPFVKGRWLKYLSKGENLPGSSIKLDLLGTFWMLNMNIRNECPWEMQNSERVIILRWNRPGAGLGRHLVISECI